MKKTKARPKFAVCVGNDRCDDLELRKIYEVIDDRDAAQEGYLRIIDESGEDYLYPTENFVRIVLPLATVKAMTRPPRKTGRRSTINGQRSAQSR
jgi:primosomal protein N'